MSKPIGQNGLARITEDAKSFATFAKPTLATKIIALNPDMIYGLFCTGAGPSDVTLQTTADSKDAIGNGTAKYTAVKTYNALPAAGGFFAALKGLTAVKVTHVKNGVGVDDAGTVAALGGRFQVRAQQGVIGADGGLGAYTPLTAT